MTWCGGVPLKEANCIKQRCANYSCNCRRISLKLGSRKLSLAMQFETEINAMKSALACYRQELVDSKEILRQKNNDFFELEFQLSSLWHSMAPEITNSSNFGKKGSFDLEDEPVCIKNSM